MVRNDRVMEIPWDVEATLLSRPNRFLGIVELDSSTSQSSNLTSSPGVIQEKVHIHDPGRLEDLLYPGNKLLLRKATNPKRKTGWDVIAAKADDEWILINSAFHRKIAEWAIANKVCSCFENVLEVIPEQKFGDSRLDFLLKKSDTELWVEVKGCTLIYGSTATFPDAPTTRGKRHVGELKKALEYGSEALIMIIVLRKDASCFKANESIDPDFEEAFKDAVNAGVQVCPLVFSYEGKELFYKGKVPLCTEEYNSIS